MVSKVSQYYQTIINRLSTSNNEDSFQEYARISGLTTGFGTIVFNVEKNGFYGIIDDNNQKFFPINYQKIKHILRDRKRIQYSLSPHPEVTNIYRWGTSARIIAIQIID
ncbi:MAG: hypothetical protein OEX07_02775 [Gammaproteobacteria bacterium]|nr:hypothetical protein [Gammaproteobacteria bacterium]